MARRAPSGLVIVLDQFEEFAILGQAEAREAFAALLADLHARPVGGLRLLLAFRSDYKPAMQEFGLPPMREHENWEEIGAFTPRAATEFLQGSQLALAPAALDPLLDSAAKLDDLAGLIRPVTLNVVGHVLAEGRGQAPSLDAGTLVRAYVARILGSPDLRDHAGAVIEQMLTAQATRRPRSEAELASGSGVGRAQLRVVLNGLAQAGLARPLDAGAAVWELAHDFVAGVLARHLGQSRRDVMQRLAGYAVPALFVAALAGMGGAIGWERTEEDRARSHLARLGIAVSERTRAPVGLKIEKTSVFAPEALVLGAAALRRLSGRIVEADFSGTEVADLAPLAGLTALQSLDLGDTQVTDLAPLAGLTALQMLRLGDTQVADLAPLAGLTALQTLSLDGTQVADLAPLAGLGALQTLHLNNTLAADLAPLAGLTALQALSLGGTRVADLAPLAGLTALQRLWLNGTQVADLAPLAGLPALRQLGASEPITAAAGAAFNAERRARGLPPVSVSR